MEGAKWKSTNTNMYSCTSVWARIVWSSFVGSRLHRPRVVRILNGESRLAPQEEKKRRKSSA
jgi:hypothetical protein